MKKLIVLGLLISLIAGGATVACRLSGSSITPTSPAAARATKIERSSVTPTASSTPTSAPSATVLAPTATASPTPTFTPAPTRIPEPTRIQFEPGASSATVTGYVEKDGYCRYVLRAMEGQMMDLAVSSPDDEVSLSAWGENGTNLRYLPQSAWCGRLPSTQDYYVKVIPSGKGTNYTLTVKVSPEKLSIPPMILVEPRTPTRIILPVDPPRLHFWGTDGFPEIVVPAEHVDIMDSEP